MSDPDQRLMRRFQKGDVAAFEVLLHKFEGPVLSLCRRYLGSRSPGIEDVAQEVFIRIYRSKHTYEPKAKVGTRIGRLDDADLVRLNRAVVVFLGLAGASAAD